MFFYELMDMEDIDPKKAEEVLKNYKKELECELKKVSNENLLYNCITNVLLAPIYFFNRALAQDVANEPDIEVYVFGSRADRIRGVIKPILEKYIESGEYAEDRSYEQRIINSRISGLIGEALDESNKRKEYWCSCPEDNIDVLHYQECTLYLIWILEFDKEKVNASFSFDGERHPFFKKIRQEWISSQTEMVNSTYFYDELFRRASLCNRFLREYESSINVLSTMHYESASNGGSIVSFDFDDKKISLNEILANKSNIKMEAYFEEPIKFIQPNHKKIRKLLEINQKNMSLVLDNYGYFIGIGKVEGKTDCNCWKVVFWGDFRWDLYNNQHKFISFKYMQPTFPDNNKRLNNRDMELLKATFTLSDKEIQRVERIIQHAVKQKHGTMVVFAENAETEAIRLKNSGIPIKKEKVTMAFVETATSIDGAMIFDPQGFCYAIGTILDGSKSDLADSSRGARYNSAIRYKEQQKTKGSNTFIVVVSEDGYVNCLSTID